MSDTIDLHHLLVEAADRLEPLPAAAVQLAGVVCRPDSGPDEIAQVLGTDPALAAPVLREANSAHSASRATVGSLDQAVVRIGAARVLAVSVRGLVGEWFESGLDLYELSGPERRLRAAAASTAAAVITSASPHPVSRDVVCAALLHGIGMDVIDAVADPEAAAPLKAAGIPIREMERELVEADHAEVGAFVLQRWGLPLTLVDAVRHQYDPEAALEAAVVSLATELVDDVLSGEDTPEPGPRAVAAAAVLGLDDRIDVVRNAVRAALAADGLVR